VNHHNVFNYEDDWYILDYEPDNNEAGLPPFCFVLFNLGNLCIHVNRMRHYLHPISPFIKHPSHAFNKGNKSGAAASSTTTGGTFARGWFAFKS
jgi:hypothetical protein